MSGRDGTSCTCRLEQSVAATAASVLITRKLSHEGDKVMATFCLPVIGKEVRSDVIVSGWLCGSLVLQMDRESMHHVFREDH